MDATHVPVGNYLCAFSYGDCILVRSIDATPTVLAEGAESSTAEASSAKSSTSGGVSPLSVAVSLRLAVISLNGRTIPATRRQR